MAKPFQFGFGGPAGGGEQIMSWISLRDLVAGIAFLIERSDKTGPVNMVSTGACRQKTFAKALGKALRKPSFMPTPGVMIKALMGQMGEELILTGQRVTPLRLKEFGFNFQDTDIEGFLVSLYQS